MHPHLHIQKQTGTSRLHKDGVSTNGVPVLAGERFWSQTRYRCTTGSQVRCSRDIYAPPFGCQINGLQRIEKKKKTIPRTPALVEGKAEEPARGGPVLTGYTDMLTSSHFCLIFPLNVALLQKKLRKAGSSLFLI